MDNKIRTELDEMLTADGLEMYGQLMAAKFGGEAEQYKPYLLAVGLELGYISVATVLNDIDSTASLLLAKIRNDSMQLLVVAAGEAVGIDREARKDAVLGKSDDGILDAEVVE